eukprot:gene17632-biopygen2569
MKSSFKDEGRNSKDEGSYSGRTDFDKDGIRKDEGRTPEGRNGIPLGRRTEFWKDGFLEGFHSEGRRMKFEGWMTGFRGRRTTTLNAKNRSSRTKDGIRRTKDGILEGRKEGILKDEGLDSKDGFWKDGIM